MLFLRLLGAKMADTDLPKNWEGATRWFLGGTLVFASGFEAVVLFWEQKYLAAVGSLSVAIILMAILLNWDRLKSKMPGLAAALTDAALDARLWAILLLALSFVFTGASTDHLRTSALYALPLVIGLIMFFAAWRFLGPTKRQRSSATGLIVSGGTAPIPPPRNPQVDQDLLHLLDFGVYQTTLVMLSRLVDEIPAHYNVDIAAPLPHEFANRHSDNSAQIYLQSVRRYVCDGSDRAARYQSLMQHAENEADRQLKQTPIDKRPEDVDPLF
jgi:hypothetical protein